MNEKRFSNVNAPSVTSRQIHNRLLAFCFTFCSIITTINVVAHDITFSPKELKKLSVEELMDLEVTLVSRSLQKLTEAALAMQVITGEDIRHSGAVNIPKALSIPRSAYVKLTFHL